jgi:hypothetical protein
MKIFDDTSFGWAIVVVTLFFIGAQIVRAVMKLLIV